MTVKLKGDIAKLQRFAEKLAGSSQFKRTLMGSLMEETITLTIDGFTAERDPYGKPWAKLQRRQGKILRDTGAMMSSLHLVDVGSDSFTVGFGRFYAQFHQSGTKRMAARVMLPTEAGGIPSKWQTAYRETADDAYLDWMG